VKIAYFDCFSGVSGDMTLGALVDLGLPFAELAVLPARLGLAGVTLAEREVRRGAFRARQVEVRVEGAQPHRHLSHVQRILEAGDLPAAARERALAVFERLARAEAAVHGTAVEQVHFHEVGAADAIIDIAGACLGLCALGVVRAYASPLVVGSGTVRAEHGVLPVPAPATALLLEGLVVDWTPVEGERVTPTGAALVAGWVEPGVSPPPFRLLAQGVGAGGRDPADRPNVLRLIVGETDGAPTARDLAVIESTIDDEQPQVLAHVVGLLLAAGARDAFLAPVYMKKGRPGVTLTALCDPADVDRLAGLILAGTSTLGLRVRREERRELPRVAATVRIAAGEVALKVVTLPDGTRRARPEYESLAALAQASGRPLAELAAEAQAAWAAGEAAPGATRPR
jgi:uncharacterized protein (TIGR00299 family) protein